METLATQKVSLVLHFVMAELDTKDRIKQTAHNLIMQYGIRSVSMDDIATKLGMSKKTIYQFYEDKDALVLAIVTEIISKSEQDCMADSQKSTNAVHEIFLVMEMVVEMFRTMNPSIVYDMQKYHPEAFAIFLKHKNEFIYNEMRQNILRGINEELYRPDLNVDIITRYRVESMMLPFNPEFQKSVKHSLADIEIEILQHFLYGIASLKGYKLILKYNTERLKK